ncbi:MAG TPA: hypothetical protein VEA69_02870 [Tepidisphaeraceae bacterium]|nr:hypothetical protein [Tepidisphaeraceae bacterium]
MCVFERCVGKKCHGAQAAAIFWRLTELGLIVNVGNYSVGGRGNVYEIRRQTSSDWDADWGGAASN